MKRTGPNSKSREASRDLEENKPGTPRKNSTRQYFFLILFLLGLVIVGFLSVLIIPFIARLAGLNRLKADGASDDPTRILMQDLNEQTLSYPLHIHEPIRTIEFCGTKPLTTAKIKQLFDNSRIAVHQNCAQQAPKEIQGIVQTHFAGLKVSQKNYSKFTPEQIIQTLKRDFVFIMQQAHPITQKLMSAFFTSRHPRISIYTDTPETGSPYGGQPMAGRYIIANNTIRLITKSAPSMIITHETSHAGAAIVTHGNTAWHNNGEFRYPVAPATVNDMISKSFPCDQDGFLDIWEQEVDQVLSYENNINNPGFLDIAQEYKPEFIIWLSEKSLNHNFNANSLNSTFILDGLAGTKVVISPILSQYNEDFVPNSSVRATSYYQTVLLKNPVRIVDLNRDTEFPGVAAIRVTPLTMEPKVRAHYLLQKFSYLKNYANSYRKLNGHCQEALGATFELNKEVIPRALPRSTAYLEKRLDDYERQQCQDDRPGLSLQV